MKIYLARAIKGNLIAEWKKMTLYLAGTYDHRIKLDGEAMRLFLAGNLYDKERYKLEQYNINVLESYYYIRDKAWMFPLLGRFKSFLLDSGAFTFMQNSKKGLNWDDYLTEYIAFINKYDIKLFFELDIDSIVGIKEVERLRERLEKETGKRCIPVWHKSRGKEYWLKMVSEYDYVAIGGIVSREITAKDFHHFHWFLNTAKEQKCKVHALGFTNMEGIKKYKFYSIDSTSWLSGNRFGAVYFFKGDKMVKIDKPEGKRVKSHKTAMHNFKEWVRFSRYLEGKNE